MHGFEIILLCALLGFLNQSAAEPLTIEVEIKEYENQLMDKYNKSQDIENGSQLIFHFCLESYNSSRHNECNHQRASYEARTVWDPPVVLAAVGEISSGTQYPIATQRLLLSMAVIKEGQDLPIDNMTEMVLNITSTDAISWTSWTWITSGTSRLHLRHRVLIGAMENHYDNIKHSVNGSLECDEGDHCKSLMNHCDPNPCQNEGVCIDVGTDYRCYCAPGYAGDICDLYVCDIFPTICGDNGTCTATGCICDIGYIGEACETFLCDLITCINGTCDIPTGECICDIGYINETCDQYICDLSDCLNNATCNVSTGDCYCMVGYIGEKCEDYICDVADCQNNATCNISTGECYCTEGFTGDQCEIYFCRAVECQNNATCIDETQECNCTEGFNGTWCEHSLCEYMVCENAGSCIRGECHCPDDYHGEFCENAYPLLTPGQIAAVVICAAIVSAGAATLGVFWRKIRIAPEGDEDLEKSPVTDKTEE